MSVQSEITRLAGAKSDIADAIAGKGVAVPSSSKLEDYAGLIDLIDTPTALTAAQILTAVQAGWV